MSSSESAQAACGCLHLQHRCEIGCSGEKKKIQEATDFFWPQKEGEALLPNFTFLQHRVQALELVSEVWKIQLQGKSL